MYKGWKCMDKGFSSLICYEINHLIVIFVYDSMTLENGIVYPWLITYNMTKKGYFLNILKFFESIYMITNIV